MRVTYDREADAAYIEFVEITDGGVARTVELDKALPGVLVDLDAEGRLLGIEVLDARANLPKEVLDAANDITRNEAELLQRRPGPHRTPPVRFCPVCAAENLGLQMVYGPTGDGFDAHCHSCGWSGNVMPVR